MDCAKLAVTILAAGQSRRFGSDKLMANLDGLPVGLHIARTIAPMHFGWRFAVCSKGAAILQHVSAAGFIPIENAAPEKGQSHSLHLAVRAAEAIGAEALLVLLADMPFVTAGHIWKLLTAGGGIIASTDSKRSMPPALFSRDSWPQLLATSGDAGARGLLAHARLVTATPEELRDIDVAADLPRPQP